MRACVCEWASDDDIVHVVHVYLYPFVSTYRYM